MESLLSPELYTSLVTVWLPRLLGALVTLLIGFWLANRITSITDKAMQRRQFDATLRPFIRSLVSVGLKVLVLLSVAGMFGLETTSFIAVFGAMAFAVGLALQGSLGHFASGVLILVFKPYKVGDLVEVGGHLGIVSEVQVFNTVLTSLDNQVIIVPNGVVTSGVIKNLNGLGVRRVDMTFGISYTDDIDKQLFCALWVRGSKGKTLVDVIYKDEWQFYVYIDGQISAREEPRQLFFSECPVCIYNTQIIGAQPPFHQVIPYIDALDVLITGNSNEIERLVDALLVLGTSVSQDDLDHMDEWKALMDIKNEDRAEYLTKDMSPVFREYVSKLLVQEIHKHSHVVDWYNPDTGISGATSGKALLTRMFDMDMYSKRIEKIYKDGIGKRIKLIGELARISGVKPEPVYVEFKRTMLHDMEEKIIALNQASFLSAQTKIETAGFDYEIEKERIESESKNMLDVYGDIE